MGKNSISDEEVNMFFLSAYVALGLNGKSHIRASESPEYFAFRHEYWTGDPRVEFLADAVVPYARGLPVSHPLAFDNFNDWIVKRSMRRE